MAADQELMHLPRVKVIDKSMLIRSPFMPCRGQGKQTERWEEVGEVIICPIAVLGTSKQACFSYHLCSVQLGWTFDSSNTDSLGLIKTEGFNNVPSVCIPANLLPFFLHIKHWSGLFLSHAPLTSHNVDFLKTLS